MQDCYSLRPAPPPNPEVMPELLARLGRALRLDEARVRRLLEADTLILDDWEARAFANVYGELNLPLDMQRQGAGGSSGPRSRPAGRRPALLMGLAGAFLAAGATTFVVVDPSVLSAALSPRPEAPRVLEASRLAAAPLPLSELHPDLFAAAWDGTPMEVRRALDEDPGANRRDEQGLTPLMYAAANNSPEVVKLLLAAGADANAASSNGFTPLLFAIRDNPDPSVFPVLTAAGADPGVRSRDGQTLVGAAQARGGERLEEIQEFFFRVARSGEAGEIRGWVASGLPVNLRDPYGQTPLMYAAQNGAEALRALLEEGADVNAASKAGWTALMYAARSMTDPEVTRLLVAAGANVDARNSEGRSALDIARSAGNRAALEVLERARGPGGPDDRTTGRTAAPAVQPVAAAPPARTLEADTSLTVLRRCLQDWERCGTEE